MYFSRFRSKFRVDVSLVALGILGVGSFGCVDPLKEDAITQLGDEAAGVAVGPLHRAGQPCLVCHNGIDSTPFTLAGTIYLETDAAQPAASALVEMANGLGAKFSIATNCAGNFFVRPGDFEAAWPVWVRIKHNGWEQIMESPINEDGSCASCHTPEIGPASPGPVYVLPFAMEHQETTCP